MNKRLIQNIINVIVLIICIIIIGSGNYTMYKIKTVKAEINNNIEDEWRSQAKRSLYNVATQFMYDVRNKTVDPYNEISLQNWAKRNISGLLNGGPTGDAFMINLSNEKFIWDGSPDCAKPEFITNGRYMKDEAIMHRDKKQAELVIGKMRQGKSTLSTYEKNWWNFDGSPEYLEWTVIPPGYLGFDDEPATIGGVKNNKQVRLLIALGTQQDEVQSTYKDTLEKLDRLNYCIEIFVFCTIIICIFNLIVYIYLSKKANK